ncbi:hypothetical protein AC578_1116 [Pseudocercospora eumusae]|uniref:Uncharacterized protein n=1 Tax=Pseudocercospora eumusae TaxID=321146 RepID=A0A139GXD9_9PEZI|nr:hypothetical protein AC578_1116 [Pseudocercospora eumusae]
MARLYNPRQTAVSLPAKMVDPVNACATDTTLPISNEDVQQLQDLAKDSETTDKALELLRDLWQRGCCSCHGTGSAPDAVTSLLQQRLGQPLIKRLRSLIEETVMKEASRDLGQAWRSLHNAAAWKAVTSLGTWALFGPGCRSAGLMIGVRRLLAEKAVKDGDICDSNQDTDYDCETLSAHEVMNRLYKQQRIRWISHERTNMKGVARAVEWAPADAKNALKVLQTERHSGTAENLSRFSQTEISDCTKALSSNPKTPSPRRQNRQARLYLFSSSSFMPRDGGGASTSKAASPEIEKARRDQEPVRTRGTDSSLFSLELPGVDGSAMRENSTSLFQPRPPALNRSTTYDDDASLRYSELPADNGSPMDDDDTSFSYSELPAGNGPPICDDSTSFSRSEFADTTGQPMCDDGTTSSLSGSSPSCADTSSAAAAARDQAPSRAIARGPCSDPHPDPHPAHQHLRFSKPTVNDKLDLDDNDFSDTDSVSPCDADMAPKRQRCWSPAEFAPVFLKRPRAANNAGARGSDNAQAADCVSIAQACFNTIQRTSTDTDDPLVALARNPQSGVIVGLVRVDAASPPSPHCWCLCTINTENQITMYCDPTISNPLQATARDHFLQCPLVADRRLDAASTPTTFLPFPEARMHGGTLDTHSALACAIATAMLCLAGKDVPESLDVAAWYFAIRACSTSPGDSHPEPLLPDFAALARTRLPFEPDAQPGAGSEASVNEHKRLVAARFRPLHDARAAVQSYIGELDLLQEVRDWASTQHSDGSDDFTLTLPPPERPGVAHQKDFLRTQIASLRSMSISCQDSWISDALAEHESKLAELEADAMPSAGAAVEEDDVFCKRLNELDYLCTVARRKAGDMDEKISQRLRKQAKDFIASIEEWNVRDE